MTERKKPYPKHLKNLMAEKSGILSKAQALSEMDLSETAEPLWLAAAEREEQIAPLLENVGHDLEAALHRISAASCYREAREFSRAANLFRAALAGPLNDQTREDVQKMLTDCLKRLRQATAALAK